MPPQINFYGPFIIMDEVLANCFCQQFSAIKIAIMDNLITMEFLGFRSRVEFFSETISNGAIISVTI